MVEDLNARVRSLTSPCRMWILFKMLEIGSEIMQVTFKKDFIYSFFLERVERRERDGEKHQCPRETSIGCLLHTPNLGPGP